MTRTETQPPRCHDDPPADPSSHHPQPSDRSRDPDNPPCPSDPISRATRPEPEDDRAGDGQARSQRLARLGQTIRYRRRAQTAEQQLQQLRRQFEQVCRERDQVRDQLQAAERRQRIDQLLHQARVTDLEAARLLTEAALASMPQADLAQVVADLRRRRPYLFARADSAAWGALAPHLPDEPAALDQAAAHAAASGDRRDLLHYLRLRRNRH